MRPANYPERVALDKLIEELLDRVTERGFLNIGDLRDALSRNNLKLPDLAGPGEFFKGDRLLLIDKELAVALDGVYRRGEIYMRGLQRFSALAFGTRVGRFLTRYVVLPFGGAFVILQGIQHLVHEISRSHVHLYSPLSVLLLGYFFFALMFVPDFRNNVGAALMGVWRGIRGAFWDIPAAILRLPVLRKIVDSPPVLIFRRFLLTPLVSTGLTVLLFYLLGYEVIATLAGSGAVFLATFLAFNSRLGRTLEETITDWFIHNWNQFRTGVLPGIFRAVMDFFRAVLEFAERLLYTIDEWFRFKSGEGRLSFAIKAVLGPVWFVLTYIIRFCLNLLIEPQINPIKHFPVVTVSHKLLLPTIPSLASLLELTMEQATAITVATMIIFSIPGIFGFLVWELKENWKLYEANRPEDLQPVAIGHHGETMVRLLRPGFHSGTLPKLFHKLRRAERRAQRSGNWKTAHLRLNSLHHVEESVRHFTDRDLVGLLRGSKGWGIRKIRVGDIRLGSNRILIELCCPELAKSGLWIGFEEQAGWLVAGIARPGWLAALHAEQAQALRTALAGFYKIAGVHLVREQIESYLDPTRNAYDITAEGLVVWPGPDFEAEAVYNLGTGRMIPPQIKGPAPAPALPVLDSCRLLFERVAVPWDDWVEAWEDDQAGKRRPKVILDGVRLLPDVARGQEAGCPSEPQPPDF
jgi:hypothetical protein